MRAFAKILLPLLFVGAASAAETPAWVKESNQHADYVLKSIAEFNPEFVGQIGVGG